MGMQIVVLRPFEWGLECGLRCWELFNTFSCVSSVFGYGSSWVIVVWFVVLDEKSSLYFAIWKNSLRRAIETVAKWKIENFGYEDDYFLAWEWILFYCSSLYVFSFIILSLVPVKTKENGERNWTLLRNINKDIKTNVKRFIYYLLSLLYKLDSSRWGGKRT